MTTPDLVEQLAAHRTQGTAAREELAWLASCRSLRQLDSGDVLTVQIVVRRENLRDTMSQYLLDQIGKTPNIRLRPRTEIVCVEGEGHVERVALLANEGKGLGAQRGTWLRNRACSHASGAIRQARGLPAAADARRAPRTCPAAAGAANRGLGERAGKNAPPWMSMRQLRVEILTTGPC